MHVWIVCSNCIDQYSIQMNVKLHQFNFSKLDRVCPTMLQGFPICFSNIVFQRYIMFYYAQEIRFYSFMFSLPTDTPMEPWLKTFDVQCKNMLTKIHVNIWHMECLLDTCWTS